MACLRQAPNFVNLGAQGWELWEVGNLVTDMHWRTYVDWCISRKLDPLSGDIATPLNFVADKVKSLEEEGHLATSAIPYKCSINTVWSAWGLPDIGQEKVARKIMRNIRARAPRGAKYEKIFFAGDILDRCKQMGDIVSLPWRAAHRKVAALIAICGACRKDDISNVRVKDVVFGSNGNIRLPYWGKTAKDKGTLHIIIPHVRRLGAESPAEVVKRFLKERPDWPDLESRPSLILIEDGNSGATRAASKDTIGRYMRLVYEESRAKVVEPEVFECGPHAYKHSAVSSFRACGMSRAHLEMYCRTKESTLSKWYDHADRLFDEARASPYAKAVLKEIVTTFVCLNPLLPPRNSGR